MPAIPPTLDEVRPLLKFHHATSKSNRIAVLATRLADAGLHLLNGGARVTPAQLEWLQAQARGVTVRDLNCIVLSASEWFEFTALAAAPVAVL
jgi:hypothetical protein